MTVGALGVEGRFEEILTVTVTLWVGVVPPAPVHVIEYEVVCVGYTYSYPETNFAPDQPPEATQEVAFVLDQLS